MSIIDRWLVATLAILVSQIGMVHADVTFKSCTQAEADYADGSGQFLLQFHEPPPESAVVAHLVTLTDVVSGQTYEGDVIWNLGFSQPNISLSFPCHAKGEAASDEECRYEAVLYTLSTGPEGPRGLATLPSSDEPAAATLLLPKLARTWHYGPLQGGWSEQVPEETFSLSSCRKGSVEVTGEFQELPFEGEWVPDESVDACAPPRGGYAEGDFMSIGNGRLITGAEFGCEILEAEEEPAGTFRLRLECGGANRHYEGEQTAEITVVSPDHLLLGFSGEEPGSFVRCR